MLSLWRSGNVSWTGSSRGRSRRSIGSALSSTSTPSAFAASSARDQRAIARYDRQRRLVAGGVRYCRSAHPSQHSANQELPPQVRNVRPCAFCGCDLEDPPYRQPLIEDVCSFECAWGLIVRQETTEATIGSALSSTSTPSAFAASSARDQRAIARYDRQRRLVAGGVRYCRSAHPSQHSANQELPPQVRNVRPCAFCGCDLEDPPYRQPLIEDVCSFEWRGV